MRKIISILMALTMLTLCACGSKKEVEETTTSTETTTSAEKFKFTKDNYPRMGGSLANLPLGEAITASVLGITRDEADNIISFTNSTTWNYEQLVNDEFDILLAYEPSEEAKEYAKSAGVELEMTPIGVDALVFICNKDNKINSLTTEQIKGIYSGKITSWSEVGGPNEKIIPYQRNKDSGSQTLFDKLVNLGDKLMDAPKEYYSDSMEGLLECISDYDNSSYALGYTVYYYIKNMESEKLNRSKILNLDGVEPNNETIGNGKYPLTNDFYVVIRKDAKKDSKERILYNWICSDQCKKIIEKENYPTRK